MSLTVAPINNIVDVTAREYKLTIAPVHNVVTITDNITSVSVLVNRNLVTVASPGPQGEQGETGPQGPQGERGEPGTAQILSGDTLPDSPEDGLLFFLLSDSYLYLFALGEWQRLFKLPLPGDIIIGAGSKLIFNE